MRRRTTALAAIVLAAAIALAGCAGLPSSGQVNVGHTADATDEPRPDFRPDLPQDGATPQQIVSGFITAASSPEGNWAIAQAFLASDYQADWTPQAGVVVDVFADRQYTVADDGTVTLAVTPVATVDAAGTYTAEDGGSTSLTYRLTQENGQWRITEAPAGLLVDEDLFENVFQSYQVMYFDPTWTYLVPDVRWFPSLNAASRIANALVNEQPAAWLADSVVTAFPEDVELTPSVPVSGTGEAEAELSEQALALDDATLGRMQAQLEASLATAGVSSVQLLVDGTPLEATAATTASTKVDSRALVLDADGFGFLVSGELTPISGLSEVVEQLAPQSVQTSPDRTQAALRLADGTVVRANADGESVTVDDRAGLIDPTIDPQGAVWTVPENTPGELRATTADGEAVSLAGAWPGASRILAMAVSRDGTRMAAVLSFGGEPVVAVAGIVRDTNGDPVSIGDPEIVARLPAAGADIGWTDDVTLGVLTEGDEPTFLDVPVGGPSTSLSAPDGAVSLAGSTSAASVRVLAADGVLYLRRSSTWVQSATGVSVLAVQQGSPG